MNKIRKPGEHPGKGRIPGTRPISTKEIRNKKRKERLMSDTASFISENLRRIEENYSSNADLFNILRAINKAVMEQATKSISQVRSTEEPEGRVSILHQCVLSIIGILEQTEHNTKINNLRYQHEVALLNSMAAELAALSPDPESEDLEVISHDTDGSLTDEEENDTPEETEEEAAE